MEEPLVSVCIPTYNARKTIDKTIMSIISQTYTNIEIHILDNKSKDDTLDIIKTFKDKRIKLHTFSDHHAAGEHNWNRCAQYMSGKYSTIFHSDDIYKPTMIERQVDVLENNPDVCAVFTRADFIDQSGNLIGTPKTVNKYRNERKLTERDVLVSTLYHGNALFTASVMMVSDIFTRLLPFRYDQFWYSSDLDLWLRAANYSHIIVIDFPLMQYRVGSSKTSELLSGQTSEDMFFVTMDSHLCHYNGLPQDALDRYEARRLVNKIKCSINSIIKIGDRLPSTILWGIKKKIGILYDDTSTALV